MSAKEQDCCIMACVRRVLLTVTDTGIILNWDSKPQEHFIKYEKQKQETSILCQDSPWKNKRPSQKPRVPIKFVCILRNSSLSECKLINGPLHSVNLKDRETHPSQSAAAVH